VDFNLWLEQFATQNGNAILLVLFGIGFTQTGLLLGPLIPGNTVLFTTGVLTGGQNPVLNWTAAALSFIAGGVLGNIANYAQGQRLGRGFFEKRETGLVSKKSLLKTEDFFGKHGRMTMIFSPFVPIVRSFAPFSAGLSRMAWTGFMGFSSLGVALWVVVLTSLGAGLGTVPWVRKNLGLFVAIVFVLATAQLLFAFGRKKSTSE